MYHRYLRQNRQATVRMVEAGEVDRTYGPYPPLEPARRRRNILCTPNQPISYTVAGAYGHEAILCRMNRLGIKRQSWRRTVIQPTPHSVAARNMILCALLRPSLTPVRNFIVTGISPNALDIPVTILPSFAGASSTTDPTKLLPFPETPCQTTHKHSRFHF
jgi:hypothetical protein